MLGFSTVQSRFVQNFSITRTAENPLASMISPPGVFVPGVVSTFSDTIYLVSFGRAKPQMVGIHA